jgi:hypothetical protein
VNLRAFRLNLVALAFLGHLFSLGPFMSPLEYKVKTSSLKWLLLRVSILTVFSRFWLPILCSYVQKDDLQTAFAPSKPQHALSDLVYAGIRCKLRTDGSPHMKALIRLNGLVLSYTPLLFRMLV